MGELNTSSPKLAALQEVTISEQWYIYYGAFKVLAPITIPLNPQLEKLNFIKFLCTPPPLSPNIILQDPPGGKNPGYTPVSALTSI